MTESETGLVERLRKRDLELGSNYADDKALLREAANAIARLTRDLKDWQDSSEAYRKDFEAAEAQRDGAVTLLVRYRNEIPLGNQPHMIAHETDECIAAIRAAKLKGDGG